MPTETFLAAAAGVALAAAVILSVAYDAWQQRRADRAQRLADAMARHPASCLTWEAHRLADETEEYLAAYLRAQRGH